jgi:predicted Zn-dependent protease
MLDNVRSILDKDPRISAWTINSLLRTSHQVYTGLQGVEAIRAVTQKRLHISILTPLPDTPDGSRIGRTSFELVEGERDIGKRIDSAVEQAGLHGHPVFELPRPGADYPDFNDADPGMRDRPWDILDQLNDSIRDAVNAEKDIELAGSELFLNHVDRRLVNSCGLDLEAEETHLTWDICLLFNSGSADTEFWDVTYRTGARYLDITREIARYAQFARDAATAVTPKSGTCPVVLTGDNLHVLLQYFIHHSSCAAKYNNSALFEPGKPVFPEPVRGDPLTLYSNPIHPGGTESYRFDYEGHPGRRVQIIENGVLKQFWGTSQHSRYLGFHPTGMFGNIEIPEGSIPWDDLFDGNDRVILVHQFSTFDPQPVAGNYLGEIRVGYEYRPDGSVIPLRGGSVTGNVVDGMIDCRLCRERDTFNGYFGPRGIRFERGQIAGD